MPDSGGHCLSDPGKFARQSPAYTRGERDSLRRSPREFHSQETGAGPKKLLVQKEAGLEELHAMR